MAVQTSWDNVADFFAIGSGASAVAVGFHGIDHTLLAAVFAAFGVAFYGVTAISYFQYRRLRRLTYERRMQIAPELTVVRGGYVAPLWGVDRNAAEGAPKGNGADAGKGTGEV